MVVSVWAFDDGYGDNKLFNGVNDILIPSHCTTWIKPMKGEEMGEGRVIDPLSHIGIEIEGIEGKFLVGRGALEQDTSLNWTGGSNKHKDSNFPIIAKACLGVLAGSRPNVVVEPIVMGLPVKEDESEDRHALLKDIIVGTHKMIIHFADGRRMIKEITVKELVTKKQPFGTFCDLILDRRGEIIDAEMARGFNVIVDIGTRTLNIYTLDALTPITELSDTFNQGVHTAYDLVNEFINERLGFKVPTGKIAGTVQKGEIRGIDLTKARERSYQVLANEVFKIVDTMMVNSWVYVDNLIITGGGAELLRNYLANMFPVKPKFMNRFSTARGFWKYGIRHMVKIKKKSIQIAMPNGGAMQVGMNSK